MSVIWSGITEGGAIVPVQVDESGKVVATADPRPELWTKTGEILTPTTPTDDIQTSGNLVLNGAFGSSTLTAADSAGVKIYALPAESGTLALESDDPPPSGGAKPHAAGFMNVKFMALEESFGVRTFQKPSSARIVFLFEADLSSRYCAVDLAIYEGGHTSNAQTWRVSSQDSGQITFRFVRDFDTDANLVPSFSFAIWDLDSFSPLLRTIDNPVPESPDDIESAA